MTRTPNFRNFRNFRHFIKSENGALATSETRVSGNVVSVLGFSENVSTTFDQKIFFNAFFGAEFLRD